jgi:hypothetical protein
VDLLALARAADGGGGGLVLRGGEAGRRHARAVVGWPRGADGWRFWSVRACARARDAVGGRWARIWADLFFWFCGCVFVE